MCIRDRRRNEVCDLPASFVVPALGADRALVGAFHVDDGLIDRDTLIVARDLAARVAIAVQRAQAVSELHDARRSPPARSAPLTVHGAPQRLRQAPTHLADNAANASRPGTEVTVRAS